MANKQAGPQGTGSGPSAAVVILLALAGLTLASVLFRLTHSFLIGFGVLVVTVLGLYAAARAGQQQRR